MAKINNFKDTEGIELENLLRGAQLLGMVPRTASDLYLRDFATTGNFEF